MPNKGVGTKIKQGSTYIGTLTTIATPEIAADTFETTVLDVADGYKTFKQNLKDGGEIPLTGYYDTLDSGQTLLKTALDAGTEDTYTIEFPAAIGTTWTFTGIVTSYKTGEANLEDAVGFEVTLKITGKPNLGITDSTGISALTFTDGSDGALTAEDLTPAFAISKYKYALTFNTETSYKVNVTAATHTIKLYVDGTLTETLTSATSSAAISIGADTSQELNIIVYESGKSPLTYTVMVARTA